MKKTLAMTLVLALVLAPALPLLAEEKAPETKPAPSASSGQATDAKADDTKTEAKDAPDLPEAKDDGISATEPEDVTQTAEPEVPKETLATPGKEKPETPEPRYKMGNFVLGFLGGALLGGAAGILFFSNGDKGFDQDKAKVMGPAVGVGAGLALGLVALLLGATTPEEAKPPKVEKESLLPPLNQTGPAVAGFSIRHDWSF